MFKFNKTIDQELEEGQISDDGLVEPRKGLAVEPKVSLPQRDSSSSQSREYVIEKIRMKALSPPPERKKDRKEHKVDEKNLAYSSRRNNSVSPDNHNFPHQTQQLPPVNSYYVYPPQNMYQYAPSGQRAMGYRPAPHPNIPYYNSYMKQMGQWQEYPNNQTKSHLDYSQPQPLLQNPYSLNQPLLYPPQPMYQAQNDIQVLQKNHPGASANYLQKAPSQQTYGEQMKRNMDSEQKNRQKKIEQIKQSIHEKIRKSENEQTLTQLLKITKNMVSENHIGQNSLVIIYKRLEENCEVKKIFYEFLDMMQLKNIMDKVKEKEIEMKVIGQEKKIKGAQIYQKLINSDPRIKTR